MKIIKDIERFCEMPRSLYVHFSEMHSYCFAIQLNKMYVLRNDICVGSNWRTPQAKCQPLSFERNIVYA